MNIEEFRDYCLSLPLATEDMRFGEECLIFSILGKIFACVGLSGHNYFALKCDPDYALRLREHHAEIEPAWHWNKRYWNQLSMEGSLSRELIESLIRHSYSEVVKKMTLKTKRQYPQLLSVR